VKLLAGSLLGSHFIHPFRAPSKFPSLLFLFYYVEQEGIECLQVIFCYFDFRLVIQLKWTETRELLPFKYISTNTLKENSLISRFCPRLYYFSSPRRIGRGKPHPTSYEAKTSTVIFVIFQCRTSDTSMESSRRDLLIG